MLWGLYWGVLLLVARQMPALPRWGRPLQILGTFVLAHIGWLIFRETDSGWLMALLMLDPFAASSTDWRYAGWLLVHVAVCGFPVAVHTVLDEVTRRRLGEARAERTLVWRTVGAALLFLGILSLRSSRGPDFIYFQF